MSDFIDFEEFKQPATASTANGFARILGFGTTVLNYYIKDVGNITTRLFPVYYIPDLNICLMSLGVLLQDKLKVSGNDRHISLYEKGLREPLFRFLPRQPGDTIYSVSTIPAPDAYSIFPTIYAVDYGIMHRRMGHPSKEVLRQAREHTKGFPTNLEFPSEDPVMPWIGETVSLGDEEDLDRTIAEAAGFDQKAFIDEHYSAA
ncbi:hypothetical protein GLOTRDRAFT_126286 [Gloeophyllum trabeum ATCC 11539]|uniref:GAG-pre-integrase domain-containing protein n=1 Tax=Gloeophyllum trabeum (strain ATCC 11539 / FP-39264 / Madison 617) TaxID=670483 RepID=S7QES1_GLOTA|nr:uncharacterized protein GLOTRDRAFT_126286 [Gloeophyllum trabeum ATCC 11539]EPQ57798.1 hypothetical protein GLOTRDRAFT_126286 [Gloeophyllum trabeum ATCC 11539]